MHSSSDACSTIRGERKEVGALNGLAFDGSDGSGNCMCNTGDRVMELVGRCHCTASELYSLSVPRYVGRWAATFRHAIDQLE